MKKKDWSIRTILVYVLIAVIVLHLFLWLIGRFSASDLGRFPFDSNVWGSVIDYLGLVLASASIYFLWRTLEKQIEATNENNRLIKAQLEEFNYLKIQRRLSFNYNMVVDVVKSDTDESGHIKVNNKGDDIFKLEIRVKANVVVYDEVIGKFVPLKHISATHQWNLKHNNVVPAALKIQNVSELDRFYIIFQDVYGLKYSQNFFWNETRQKFLGSPLRYVG